MGALIGTIMAGNVFFNIMPNQRKMMAAVADKQNIDPSWGAGAKLRSLHNNYFTLPLLFIMISNHYPMTYQHPQNYLVLIAIMVVAAWIRHFFNLRHVGTTKPSILVSGVIAMMAIALWVSWPQTSSAPVPVHTEAAAPSSKTTQVANKTDDATSIDENSAAQGSTSVTNERVANLIATHCVSCHSRTPTDDIFKVAPLGVVLDSWQDIERFAPQLVRRTTVTKDMPFLNKTNMTEEERQEIAQWFAQRQ